jgi:hypothetical protein
MQGRSKRATTQGKSEQCKVGAKEQQHKVGNRTTTTWVQITQGGNNKTTT